MKDAGEFLLTLLHSSTNAHLLHWRSKSYAQHVALGTFYSEIIDLADQIAEALMGSYDMTLTFPQMYYSPASTAKAELEALKDYVFEERKELPQDTEIQNLIDEVAQLIDSTLYLLRFP